MQDAENKSAHGDYERVVNLYEATIDDNGIRPDEYEGVAKVSPETELLTRLTADSLYPVKWGRRIFWDHVTRAYTVTISGDTLATVLVTKSLPGAFWVGWGIRSLDTVYVDTIIKKPFVETVERKILFRRIGRHEEAMRNWVPVAITMVRGTSGGVNAFTVVSMEVSESIGGFDTTITDLEGARRLQRAHRAVSAAGDQDKVAEGPGACLMIVRDGRPIMPPVTAGVLESITRATLVELLKAEMHLDMVEREIDRTELYVADEAFFCGSAWEITPITSPSRTTRACAPTTGVAFSVRGKRCG